jgi:P-type Ca2+ transporter type 2C
MPIKGLSSEEALNLLKQYGPNEIKEAHKTSPLEILIRQVKKNFIVYLLSLTAVASFLLGKGFTGFIILIVIAVVVITGFIQEYKAEKAIGALKKMIMPVTRVIRDGKEKEVSSEQIVPGDIVILRTGEKVPADCIVIDESNLKANESILTGESVDVKKTANPSEQNPSDDNRLFMGTFIVNGKCIAKVIHTGMNTKFGKIADMISTAEKKLPLQDKVNNISKYMVVVSLTAAITTGLVLFYRADAISNDVIVSILIIVIALAVSSFPEGFPVVLITTLAAGVSRMAKQNAIINRMSIIETLGETSVICSDKTGTITKGEMTVRKIYTDEKLLDVEGVGYDSIGEIKGENIENDEALKKLIECSIICNDSNIERTGEDSKYKVTGSATEGALLILGSKLGLFKENFPNPRVEEIPFDSMRKMMSVLYKLNNGKKIVYAKGAPEKILSASTHILSKNKIEPLSEAKKKEILEIIKQLNTGALRSLAFAYKENDSETYKEDSLIFAGVVGMEDPPREEVSEAISLCLQSGIKVKMITGDNKETAQAIAEQVGIQGNIITGEELNNLSDEEQVNEIAIFARVKPEDKLRIVKALKANNEIVTMTGDGVNDAPALKEAHIGVAMGINGTDVSRSAADITLKDDNFATIVTAIKEGRTVFNNIRKFVTYQLSCNLADIYILFMGMLVAPFLGWYTPIITALQILFINIVTDNAPALTLGFNPTSKDIMREKPRKNADIINNEFLNVIILNGVTMGVITFCVAFLSFNVLDFSTEEARTTVLVSVILMQVANAYNFRSFRFGVLNRGIFVNKYLVMASLFSIFATLLIIYSPLNSIFETTPLGAISWIIGITSALLIVVIFDVLKFINNKTHALLKYSS